MQSQGLGPAVSELEVERLERARLLGTALWSEEGRADVEALPRLVAEGLEKGF